MFFLLGARTRSEDEVQSEQIKGNLRTSVALMYTFRIINSQIPLPRSVVFVPGGTESAARGIRQANDIRQMTKLPL